MNQVLATIRRRPDASAYLGIALLTGIGLAWFLALGWTLPLYETENLAEWYPYREFFNRTVSRGLFPAWCPDLLCGFPFIGWAHASGLAPAGIIYYLLPFERAATVSLFLHAGLATTGLYYLQRAMQVRPYAAFLCATAVGFGYFLPAEQRHFLPRLLSLSWTPLMWAFLAQMLRQKKLVHFLGFVFTASLCCLGGHVEIFARSMSLALFVLLLVLTIYRPPTRDLVSGAVLYLAAVAMIFLVAAPQLLDTLKLLGLSTRQAKYFYPAYAFISGWQVATLFFPFMAVNLFIVWGLAASLPTLRRDRTNATLVFTIAVCFALAFNFLQVLHLTHLIPVFNRMLWHVYMLHLAAFISAVLAGRIMDGALSGAAPSRTSKIFPWFAAAHLFAIAIFLQVFKPVAEVSDLLAALAGLHALALVFIGLPAFPGDRRRTAFAVGFSVMVIFGPLLVTHDKDFKFQFSRKYRDTVEGKYGACRVLNIYSPGHFSRMTIPYQSGILDQTQSFDFYLQVMPLWSYEFFCLLKPFWTQADWLNPTRDLKAIMFDNFKRGNFLEGRNFKLFNFLNTCLIASDHENLKFAPDYQIAYFIAPHECVPRRCVILDAGQSPWRRPAIGLASGGRFKHTVFLPPGSRLEFGVAVTGDTAVSFQVLLAQSGSESFHPVFQRTIPAGEHDQAVDLKDYSGQTIDLVFAVTDGGDGDQKGWFIAPAITHDGSPFHKLLEENDLRIYQNPQALPRAFLVHRFKVLPEKQGRLEFMASPEFDPARTVVLENDPAPVPVSGEDSRRESVAMVKYSEGELRLTARLDSPGILVMSETWYPGWKARVDGVEKPIFRANHAFRGLALGPGKHDIQFVYHPASVRVGLFSSAAFLLSLAAVSFSRVLKNQVWQNNRKALLLGKRQLPREAG